VSWAIGWDGQWERDIGYGVPAFCDHPGCGKEIDRGLAYVCGGDPYGGEHGCGLYFCAEHREVRTFGRGKSEETVEVCRRCRWGKESFAATPDHPRWIAHKLTDPSWKEWRDENPKWCADHSTPKVTP